MIETLVWLGACFMVIATVSIHYEVMSLVSDRVIPWAQKRLHNRRVIAIAISGLLIGHIIEIWLFAFVTMLLVQYPLLGAVQGDSVENWYDFLYLSSVNYTSLGDGGIRLIGPARVMAATETLVGMMMIAWSASFTYLKMEQIWRSSRKE